MKRICLCILMALVMLFFPLCFSAQEDVYPAPLLRDGVVGELNGGVVIREDGKIYGIFPDDYEAQDIYHRSTTKIPGLFIIYRVNSPMTIDELRAQLERGESLRAFVTRDVTYRANERILLLNLKDLKLPCAPGFEREEKVLWERHCLKFRLVSSGKGVSIFLPVTGKDAFSVSDWKESTYYLRLKPNETEVVDGKTVSVARVKETYEVFRFYQEVDEEIGCSYYYRDRYDVSKYGIETFAGRTVFVVTPTDYFEVSGKKSVTKELIDTISFEPYFPNGAYFEEASEAEDPDSEESNAFPWLWVGIGGGAAVVMVGAVAAALIVRKKRRKAVAVEN